MDHAQRLVMFQAHSLYCWYHVARQSCVVLPAVVACLVVALPAACIIPFITSFLPSDTLQAYHKPQSPVGVEVASFVIYRKVEHRKCSSVRLMIVMRSPAIQK